MNTIAFRNEIQVALWEEELCGQISDGFWENTKPFDHWEVWCDADVTVDPERVGCNFLAIKCNYDLNRTELLDCVGDRMLVLARLVKHYGLTDGILFSRMMSDNGSIMDTSIYKGACWDRIRENLVSRMKAWDVSAAAVQVVAKNAAYTLKNMRVELKDMKKIIKNQG